MKYFIQYYTVNGQQIKTYSSEESRPTVPDDRTQIEVSKEVFDMNCDTYRAKGGKYTKFDIVTGQPIGIIPEDEFIRSI